MYDNIVKKGNLKEDNLKKMKKIIRLLIIVIFTFIANGCDKETIISGSNNCGYMFKTPNGKICVVQIVTYAEG